VTDYFLESLLLSLPVVWLREKAFERICDRARTSARLEKLGENFTSGEDVWHTEVRDFHEHFSNPPRWPCDFVEKNGG
jgi:hypothetical protein